MFKSDVINFYGTKAKVAKAAGVDPSAVSQWQELVPEGRAMRLQEASGGELLYDRSCFATSRPCGLDARWTGSLKPSVGTICWRQRSILSLWSVSLVRVLVR